MKLRTLFASLLLCTLSYSALAQSAPSQVTMWLYRANSDDSGLSLALHMDGRKLANLNRGQFFGVQVPAGLHAFSWTVAPGAQQVVIPVAADRAYWEVKFQSSQPFLSINPVPAEKTITEMSGLRPIDPMGVFDSRVIVPSQSIPQKSTAVPVASAPAVPVASAPTVPVASAPTVPVATAPAVPVVTARPIEPIAPQVSTPQNTPISGVPPVREANVSVARAVLQQEIHPQESNEHEALNSPRRFEIFWAPYSFSKQEDVNLHGGEVEVGLKVTNGLSFIADLGAHKSADEVAYIDGNEVRAHVETLTYRFGPKFSIRPNDRLTTFFQFTAGGTRVKGVGSTSAGGATVSGSASVNGFAGAAGAGVDLAANKWLSIRVIQSEYSFYRVEGANSHGFRIGGGFVFRLK
jgi:hypothetical protein